MFGLGTFCEESAQEVMQGVKSSRFTRLAWFPYTSQYYSFTSSHHTTSSSCSFNDNKNACLAIFRFLRLFVLYEHSGYLWIR